MMITNIIKYAIKISRLIKRLESEALIWAGALLYLAISNPEVGEHFTFCFFRIIGFEHCPGCGLGHSIAFLLNGDPVASWQAHPLGLAATLLLSYRIITLTKRSFIRSRTS